jgi:hypothetical protein
MTSSLSRRVLAVAVGGACVSNACIARPQTVLERLLESRRLSAEMLVQLEKELEAGNRAVMSDTDESSRMAAQDAQRALETLQSDSNALGTLLDALEYSPERASLREFTSHLSEFTALNREILELAALDTNVKAQKLSFDAAQGAADRFAAALAPIRSGSDAGAHAIASDAVAALREIQVLEAPHIVEAQDAVMDALEGRMRQDESLVRQCLSRLAAMPVQQSAARNAATEFENFLRTHAEILQLSRRNSNVKSLALSLGRKRVLAAQCEDDLRAVQEALDKRDLSVAVR